MKMKSVAALKLDRMIADPEAYRAEANSRGREVAERDVTRALKRREASRRGPTAAAATR